MADVAVADVKGIEYLFQHFTDVTNSLGYYFRYPFVDQERFYGISEAAASAVLEERQREANLNSCLSLLATLEAEFREDYQRRCINRQRDNLSRRFRELYKSKKLHVRLEDDILEAWKREYPNHKSIIGDIIAALSLRHWLAHGRSWNQNLARRYDFTSLYLLASQAREMLDPSQPV